MSHGGSGQITPEWVDGLNRNQWTDWIGMGGRISPESVDGLSRNTHMNPHIESRPRAQRFSSTRLFASATRHKNSYSLAVSEECSAPQSEEDRDIVNNKALVAPHYHPGYCG
jgi:hypothetical protein